MTSRSSLSQKIANFAPQPRRRQLIAGAATFVLTHHGDVRAQQPALRRIGYLGNIAPSTPLGRLLRDTFVAEMRRLGWVEGVNASYVYRFANGNLEQLPVLARELVAAKVDVIAALPTVAVGAAKAATSKIPIVFVATEPIEYGLIKSLERPGGNLTGVSMVLDALMGKRMELLTQAVSGIERIAYLGLGELKTGNVVRAAAKALNKELIEIDALPNRSLDLAKSIAEGKRADAWFVDDYPQFTSAQTEILSRVAVERKPAMFSTLAWARNGGLMAYSEDIVDLWRQAAGYVDHILRGAKPEDLPVEEPRRFVLVVNLRTARSLGITIRRPVLLQADEVIE